MKRLLIILVLLVLLVGAIFYLGTELIAKDGTEPSIGESTVQTPEKPEEPAEEESPEDEGDWCNFSTTDVDGNAWDTSMLADYELIMLNFWEPWCGPCVAEMPDLQKLYENYADKGFLLLGVFSTQEGALDTIASTGVKYPILNYSTDFDYFQTGYVPNTIFLNSEGLMVDGPHIGARSYEEWAEIVESLL